MNTFYNLLGFALVLWGLGLLISMIIRALAYYREQNPPQDNWAKWDAYEGKDPEIAKIKGRWAGVDYAKNPTNPAKPKPKKKKVAKKK